MVNLKGKLCVSEGKLIARIELCGAIERHPVEEGSVGGTQIFDDEDSVRRARDQTVPTGNPVGVNDDVAGFAAADHPLILRSAVIGIG